MHSAAIASFPDRLWVADLTFAPTLASLLYLAVVVDAWNRRTVGRAMADHLRTELVLDAFEMALGQPRPIDVVHHSDQGNVYISLASRGRPREADVWPSMVLFGDACDNAMCDSVFAPLERELLAC